MSLSATNTHGKEKERKGNVKHGPLMTTTYLTPLKTLNPWELIFPNHEIFFIHGSYYLGYF
jgi:hypothetical protein